MLKMRKFLLASIALLTIFTSYAQSPRVYRSEFITYDKREDAAKKDAKMHGKKKHKKWPIVLLIILLLLGGGGYFLYNYVNSRYQKVVGDIK